jgi:hypothetical protein
MPPPSEIKEGNGYVMCARVCVCVLVRVLVRVRMRVCVRSQDSSVVSATYLRAGQQRNRGSIPGRGKTFSLLHNVHTGCNDQKASCRKDTGSSFPGVKGAGE